MQLALPGQPTGFNGKSTQEIKAGFASLFMVSLYPTGGPDLTHVLRSTQI